MVIDIGLEYRNTLEQEAWRVTRSIFCVFFFLFLNNSRDMIRKSDAHVQCSKMRAEDHKPCLYEWEIDNYLIN